MTSPPRIHRGFSLIELMTSMVIGSLILLAAAALWEDGVLETAKNTRYASWDGELGRSIMQGDATLASLRERSMTADEPMRHSGRQEALENLVARYIERTR